MVTVLLIILQLRRGALFPTNNLDGWKILHSRVAEEQSNYTHVVAHAPATSAALKSQAWG